MAAMTITDGMGICYNPAGDQLNDKGFRKGLPCKEMPMIHWLTNSRTGFLVILVAGMLLVGLLYLLPSLLAWSMGCPRAKGILVLNVALGWTVIGWLAALIWAIMEGNGGTFDS
ncbi:superinfection immunity protein [Acidithiobacillus sulfuriphilus]|uniref:superinfection immunity protein n=1 Tax=Acidithiobacillus sulfuriphilus TaxID=1867749 RepID=UPI003F5E9135